MATIVPESSQTHMQDFRELVLEFVSWGVATFRPNETTPPDVFANLDRELADLPGKYAEPKGGLFVAYVADVPAGCIAGFQSIHGDLEVSRLWVRSDFRGMGIGERLVEALLRSASQSGYQRAVLRSHKGMTPAHKIYHRVGFAGFDGNAYFQNFEDEEVAMHQDLV